MLRSLVGSEMCIRDRLVTMYLGSTGNANACLVVKNEHTKKLKGQTQILTGKGSVPCARKTKKHVNQHTPLVLMKQLCLKIQNVSTLISKAKNRTEKKAEILNHQYYSVFSVPDGKKPVVIPSCIDHSINDFTISANGILKLI